MNNEKSTKIKCLISALVSTNIWFFIFIQMVYTRDYYTPILYIAFLFPLALQFSNIILAINASFTAGRLLKKSANICVTYSIISFILFLIVSGFVLSE